MENPKFTNMAILKEDHKLLVKEKVSTGKALHWIIKEALDYYFKAKGRKK